MPVKKRSRRLIASVVILVVILATAGYFWRDECLVAECRGRMLFAWPIRAGDFFEVTYTHSLNLSPVTDVIEWNGDDLTVTKSIFKTFGAGIPTPVDAVGSELLFMGDHYELIGINKHMPGFSIMTQQTPNQKITFNKHEVYLLDIIELGAPVYITVKRVPFIMRAAAITFVWV